MSVPSPGASVRKLAGGGGEDRSLTGGMNVKSERNPEASLHTGGPTARTRGKPSTSTRCLFWGGSKVDAIERKGAPEDLLQNWGQPGTGDRDEQGLSMQSAVVL